MVSFVVWRKAMISKESRYDYCKSIATCDNITSNKGTLQIKLKCWTLRRWEVWVTQVGPMQSQRSLKKIWNSKSERWLLKREKKREWRDMNYCFWFWKSWKELRIARNFWKVGCPSAYKTRPHSLIMNAKCCLQQQWPSEHILPLGFWKGTQPCQHLDLCLMTLARLDFRPTELEDAIAGGSQHLSLEYYESCQYSKKLALLLMLFEATFLINSKGSDIIGMVTRPLSLLFAA